jgi:hypothetical protein
VRILIFTTRSFRILAICSILAWTTLTITPVGSRGQSIFDSGYKRPQSTNTPTSQPALPAQVPPVSPSVSPGSADQESDTPAVHREAVPDRGAVAQSEKEIESSHSADLRDASAPSRRRVALSLLDDAGRAEAGSAEQFALYDEAIKLAQSAHSLRVAFLAIDGASAVFACDSAAMKVKAMAAAAIGAAPAELSSISNVEAMLSFAEELLISENFRDLTEVESKLKRAMPAISDPDLKIEVRNHLQSIELARTAREKVAPMLAVLRQSPHDAAANLAVGQYRCFVCGQWEQGLPMLARSGDAKLAKLASDELAPSPDSDYLVGLGEGESAAGAAARGRAVSPG